MKSVTFIDCDTIIQIHIKRIAGDVCQRVNREALESAVSDASATFEGEYLNRSIFSMAASYMYNICQSHPFYDGNKRTAFIVGIAFLELNGICIHNTDEERFIDIMLDVATGSIDKETLAKTLHEYYYKT